MTVVRFLIPFLMLAAMSAAQDNSEQYIERTVSIAFVPGLSSNGIDAGKVSSRFSLNIIGGNLGRLDGAELGSVFNVEKGDARFFQAGGVLNVVGGDFTGVQLAGVLNTSGGLTRGAQLAGVVNVARQLEGAQVGVVNVAGSGRGAQVGVVNVAEDIDVPIGLVNVIKNGQFHVNVYATEFSFANIGIKTGSKVVHTILTLGWQPGSDTQLVSGLGIGGHIPLDPFFVDIDAVQHFLVRGFGNWEKNSDRQLTTLRLIGGWQLADGLALTAGPTLNIWTSPWEDGSAVPFYNLPIYHREGNSNVRIWPGFAVGLQLL